jgi:hypothetical protein
MAKCRNCGHEFKLYEELYVDGGTDTEQMEYHCIECHNILYTEDKWIDLNNEDEDNYYFTNFQGDE